MGATNNISQVNPTKLSPLLRNEYRNTYLLKTENLFIATLSGLSNTCFKASVHEHDFLKSSSCLNMTQEKRKKDWFSQEDTSQRREKKKINFVFR